MTPISVVIPTCNRKGSLLKLLDSLDRSDCPTAEVLVVDGGTEPLGPEALTGFRLLNIHHLCTQQSVCKQRNTGIRMASSPRIFLLDDDMEVPPDYLGKINQHLDLHPEAGAVSGLVLQQENGLWKGSYPVRSWVELSWKYLFRLGIWGALPADPPNIMTARMKSYYLRQGNHLSKAGWPVITDFSGTFFQTPVYGLGASLIRKEWLLASPYEERLDSHGIGDHYGVAAGFPTPVHVLTNAVVYHHHSAINRPEHSKRYYQRILAMDHFRRRYPSLAFVKKGWLLWSLCGNLLTFLYAGEGKMVRISLKLIRRIALGKNPYDALRKTASGAGATLQTNIRQTA